MITIPGTDKFFAHSENVNTTISGSESALEESHWYTIDDLANTVKPYKVFTALLTQSGGDATQSLSGSGSLVIGVTYMIEDNGGSGWDFTNVGAPNNDINISFVATGTTPNSWGESGYLIYNTGAPVVTVLENTIGNIWFTYDTPGLYLMRSNGLFTENKTFYQNILVNSIPTFIVFNTSLTTNEIYTTGGDGSIYSIPIEFRVYN